MRSHIVQFCGMVFLLLLLGQSGLVESQDVPIVGDTKALFPIADAAISDSNQNSNYGSQSGLWVGYDPILGYTRTLLQFDVAAEIPAGARIDSATMQLYM